MTGGREWNGKQLGPEAMTTVLNITFHGYGLARDFAHQGHPDSYWFVQAAKVAEGLGAEHPLTLWAIGAYLNVFPVTRDSLEDYSLEFGPPEEALRHGRSCLTHALDPDLYELAVRRRAHAREFPGVAW
jgi:hypothetical protein